MLKPTLKEKTNSGSQSYSCVCARRKRCGYLEPRDEKVEEKKGQMVRLALKSSKFRESYEIAQLLNRKLTIPKLEID